MESRPTRLVKRFATFMRLEKPSNSIPCIIFLVSTILTLIGTYEACVNEQDNDKLAMGISMSLAVTVISFCALRDFYNPKRLMQLISLIDDDFFATEDDFPDRVHYWEKIYELQKNTVNNMKFIHECLYKGVLVIYVCYLIKNLVTYLLNIPIYPGNESSDAWLTPYLMYRHIDFEPVIYFLYAISIQGTSLAVICFEGYAVVLLLCLSTERVLGDFHVFYQLVNLFCLDYSNENYEKYVEKRGSDYHKIDLSLPRADLKRIVQLHQRIIRNNKSISNSSAYDVSSFMLTVQIDSCMSIFFGLKSEEMHKTLIFGSTFIMINVLLFLVYKRGQEIFNQNELLRESLAKLPWTDKPSWLRQTVHIMMTQANVDIVMKPYGFYVLNYISFKDLMKFTFSVGNFLYRRNRLAQIHAA